MSKPISIVVVVVVIVVVAFVQKKLRPTNFDSSKNFVFKKIPNSFSVEKVKK